jgi:hypothetical protein
VSLRTLAIAALGCSIDHIVEQLMKETPSNLGGAASSDSIASAETVVSSGQATLPSVTFNPSVPKIDWNAKDTPCMP